VTPLRAVPLALVVALAGCVARSSAPVPGVSEGEWAAVRRDATRRAKLYDGLIHRATATATHLGAPEREARARRLGAWLGWTPEELDRRLAQERAEAETGEEFLVAFYTSDSKANDLDAPASIWRIAVEADEGDLVASRVQALDADATVRGLFPYVSLYDTVYRVVFPRAPDGPLEGRTFVLEFSSALGRLDLYFGAPLGTERPEAPEAPEQPGRPP
jgi:hypothetical protein